MTGLRVVRRPCELRRLLERERAAGRRLALVPTMGALHAGHLRLVEEARRRADVVVVSIFVNPTQFGPGEDLARYPRSLDADVAACRAAGAHVVFAPEADALYPDGAQTWVEVAELTKPLCGRDRPGHFRGVTTVVAKLFGAAQPHVAVFGEKDYQQLVVVRRMVRDLCLGVEVVGVPIVRESDGLALSSRNVHLDPEIRAEALCLVRALGAAERAVAAGETARDAVLRAVALELGKAAHASVDYAELRDPETLAPAGERLLAPTLLALAVGFPVAGGGPGAGVRLIDNRVLHPSTHPEERS